VHDLEAGARLEVIGRVEGCFDERFGTPRQPGLTPDARAELILLPPYDHPDLLRGLEDCSHVWLVFGFHRNPARRWRPTVRPPRLGGNRRRGVFATRSPFRPNPIGLSVVRLDGLIHEPRRCGLRLRDHDLVNGTPVYDVKPYIPYSDCVPDARPPAGFDVPPRRRPVVFLAEAEAGLERCPGGFRALVEQTLSLDPRPAYRGEDPGRQHGVVLMGINVRFRVIADRVEVVRITPGEHATCS
jgi:tRNA-Thr(GGU) m(6)t(6)A37 methyltransferase TsaA